MNARWFGREISEGIVKTLILVVVFMLSAVDLARAATTYVYDDLGRLKQALYDNGKEIDYSYDPAGNRSSVVTQTTPPRANAVKPSKKMKPKLR